MERSISHEVEVCLPRFDHSPFPLSRARCSRGDASQGMTWHVYEIPHATAAWIAKEMLGKDHSSRYNHPYRDRLTLLAERSFEEITRFRSPIRRLTAVSEYLKDEASAIRRSGDDLAVTQISSMRRL